MFLIAYVNNTDNKAKVGWIKDNSKPKRLGANWEALVFSDLWFSTPDAQALLDLYCHYVSMGYTVLNKRIPGSPLQREVAWLKNANTFECGTLDYDVSVAATVPNRFYLEIN